MLQLEQQGFFRAAIASPELKVADVTHNAEVHAQCLEHACDSGTRLVVFPELSLTGYTCADLFYQQHLLKAAREGLVRMAEITAYEPVAAIVGLPLEIHQRLYNCAALVCAGDIIGIVPKIHIPNTREFYEARWFASGRNATVSSITIGTETIPFGVDLLFRYFSIPDILIGIEICEDLWSVCPPSGDKALAGAMIMANLSASDEELGKKDYRRALVSQQSARCLAGYLYAASGPHESSTDLVYSGHGMVAENGRMLTEQNRFQFETNMSLVDMDIQALSAERTSNSSFRESRPCLQYREFGFKIPESDRPTLQPRNALNRPLSRHPFIPQSSEERTRRCEEIFALQSTALAKRIQHIGCERVAVGISGGLDSALALLVTVKAFDKLQLKRDQIHGISMPGPGTTQRTRDNAAALSRALNASFQTIPIDAALQQHLKDIGHDGATPDITYENAQARERTQILMDLANRLGGFVVGTGDLSEAALGWCTFNADHMSMYHVNIGLPKTLVKYVVSWCADTYFREEASEILSDIVETPITPELLPAGQHQEFSQKTEDVLGPYELHDFFLYYMCRYHFTPSRIFMLAKHAFEDNYEEDTLLEHMTTFYTRFFDQQYKRSAMPDGPKIGTVALSPRGDWRMPSDADPRIWLDEIKKCRIRAK